MNLYFLHYNNYYNRIVKRESMLSDYTPYLIGTVVKVNFVPNDYINTQQIINWNYEDPDYMLAVDDDGDIESRWFVISTTRTRAGQLQLDLRRDLIADYYDEVINAPCFIEKALPKSIRDPAIYNSEDMTFNQIKQKEILLYDETKCPWIVGYIPRDSFKGESEESRTIKIEATLQGTSDIEVDSLSNWEYYKYNNQIIAGAITNPNIVVAFSRYETTSTAKRWVEDGCKVDINGNYIGRLWDNAGDNTGRPSGNVDNNPNGYQNYYYQMNRQAQLTDSTQKKIVQNFPSLANDFKTLLNNYVESEIPYNELTYLQSIEGKTIYESSTGNYYTIELERTPGGGKFDIPVISDLGIKMNNAVVKVPTSGIEDRGEITENPGASINPFYFTSDTDSMIFRVVQKKINVQTIIPTTRYEAYETPYDIFCIPYSDNLTIFKNGQVYLNQTNKSAGISLAQSIPAKMGQGAIYDIQLLPYCPVRYCIMEDGSFDVRSAIVTPITIGEGTEAKIANVILWASSDNFSFNIPVNIPEKQNVIEKKIANQTDFIRLCAQNYSNSFEFNPQMNEGLSSITILCHCKPFNPYIKLQPNFQGLYGNAYNDARGLICNGDFSLAQVTSAWANYELNNKNYQNIFDRQIQNMQVNNAVQREREMWGVASGALNAGVSGATAGMIATGNPLGALVGLGTAGLSLAGGIRDIQLNDRLRNEALDYTKDMFGYQLGNIKAIPQGLAKTSAISPDNKFVPFIEFYSCTSEEKIALENKIKYNGATIMMIGKIQDYQINEPTYIKGKLIRLEDVNEDFHIINAIAEELFKGVFI